MKSKLNYLVGVSLKRKIKTKWFLIANIVLAIILVGIINIDSIITMFGGDFNEKTNVYVLDNTNKTYDIFISQFNNANSLLTNSGEESEYNIIKEERSLDELKNLINNDEKEKDSIIIVFNDSETNYLDVSLITKEYIDLIDMQSLTTALNNTKTTIAIYNSNISEEELTAIYSPVNIERIYLDNDKTAQDENAKMIMTTVFPILILPFFMLIIYLVQMIGAEVNDEKQTRGMEIIISNVSPKTHFFSKVIAGNLFVLLQGALLFIYSFIGVLIRKIIGGNLINNGVTDQVKGVISTALNSNIGLQLKIVLPLTIILMLITFLAYSLLAGVLASMTTNTEDFQQLQTPIMVVLLLGYYTSMMAGMFEGSIFIKILSFIPFVSAILSPSLLILGQIGIFEVIISIILMIIVIYLLIKYGLRIYKTGILNYSSKNLWKKMFKALKNK
jgi:ABC-2 type transport system permease protein